MPESDQKKPVSTESSVDYIALLEQAKVAPEGAQQSAETFGGDVSEFGPDGGRRTLDTELAHQQANYMDASEVAGVEARQRAEAARKILDGIKVENAIIADKVSDGRYVVGRADTAENADADSVMAERMAKDVVRVAEHAKSSAQESSDRQARQAKRDFEAGYDRTTENAA